jgi:hypothetical protein
VRLELTLMLEPVRPQRPLVVALLPSFQLAQRLAPVEPE